MRVLVTASRDLKAEDEPALEQALLLVVGDVPGRHTLTHGGAKGGDKLFAGIATRLGWLVVKRRAYWSADCLPECDHGGRKPNRYGPGEMCLWAGRYRNARMVSEGHDVCLAVFKVGARNAGTFDCSQRARAAGILTRPFRVDAAGVLSEIGKPAVGEQLELGPVAS